MVHFYYIRAILVRAQRCPNMFGVPPGGGILGEPGVVSRVGINGGEKFQEQAREPPEMLLLANQFHDSFECFSLIRYKKK